MLSNGSSTLRILLAGLAAVAIAAGTVLQALDADATAAWGVALACVSALIGQHIPAPTSKP